MEELKLLRDQIVKKYKLWNHVDSSEVIYFLYMNEFGILEKELKRGRIIKDMGEIYTVKSDTIYEIPKCLSFNNRFKAFDVLNKISIDELRILI